MDMWIEGLCSYLPDWWNILDTVALSLYLVAFVLLAGLAHRHCRDAPDGAACRYFTSAGECALCFTRLAYILPAHESLGTLQISIGRMIDDMIRFMFILTIILTAFLCGLNNVYVPYQETEQLGNFNETFQFLFWTMFGMEEHSVVDMPQFLAPEFVGQALYGIFTIVTVIVLLNMLTAMIANSFQKIDTADMEWKFACSKLYLSYFREGLTLPVPFNILPSPKATFYLLRRIFLFICCCCSCCKTKKPDSPPTPTFANPGAGAGPGEEERGSYWLHVIKALVRRYIETVRREFEETRWKDLGNRLTELTKTVSRLQSEVAGVQRTLVKGRLRQPPDGASILCCSITQVCNSFQNLGPPIPETPEVTVPGIVGTQVSSETGLQDAGRARTPVSGESGPSSPAHVLGHREQELEGAGDVPQEEDLGTKEGS
uniref:Ion transport domain-containing protein n=1 Tax=Balaenoptera musculus TaxID=9771 RepID=A0A8C0I642_BALMU